MRLLGAVSVAAMAFGLLPVSNASAAITATTACTNSPEDRFTDTGPEDANTAPDDVEDSVDCLVACFITVGQSATLFGTGNLVTRGQLASFVMNILDRVNGFSRPAAAADRFPDDNTSVHQRNINDAAALGIIRGFPDGTFRPAAPVTRAQMATFLVRTLEVAGITVPAAADDAFTDDETSLHENNINRLEDLDIVDGEAPGIYNPDRSVTRGTMAFFLTRTLELIVDAGRADPCGGNEALNVSPRGDATIVCTNTAIDATTPADDRTYTVTGLDAGEPYRITLVNAANTRTDANGNTVFDRDPASPAGQNLALTGTVLSRIVTINGTAVTGTPDRTVGGVLPVNGTITFTIDCGGVERITPVVYDDGGASTRLELGADGQPIEEFGTGGTITFTAGPVTSNQTFVLAPGSETRSAGGPASAANTRTCIVTGIPAGATVDAVLLPSSDLTVNAAGQTVFQDNDSDNLADVDAVGAVIVNVNGTAVTPAQQVNDIVAITGAIAVTIYGAVSTDVTLVVTNDSAGLTANRIDLTVPATANAAAKSPREVFGTGCRTVFANEAPDGGIATTVTSTSKDLDLFTGTGGLTYFYDANDVFQVNNGTVCVQTTLAVFEAALSIGDTVSGTYNGDPQFPSTFCLVDAAPVAPASLTATVVGTTVTLSFPESTTATTDLYRIFRVIRPAGGVCPAFNTAAGRTAFGAAIGTVADPTPSTVGGTTLTFTDAGLAQNTVYCYAVVSVDDGDESNVGTVANDVLTGQPGDAAGPRLNDVRANDQGTVGILDAGDLVQFIFSEPMAATVDDAGQLVRVVDADGTVAEVTCGVNATCVLQGAGTFNGTAQVAGTVLRVSITGPVAALNSSVLGTVPGVQFPATITNVSAGFDDAAGNQLDLAGSPDRVIDVAAITPIGGADITRPDMTSASGSVATNTITVTYNEAVTCPATAAGQFSFDDAGSAAVSPTAATCNGTSTVTLTFAAGELVAGDLGSLTFTDDNAAADANDVVDLSGNQTLSPETITLTAVA